MTQHDYDASLDSIRALMVGARDLPTLADLLGRPSWMDAGACAGSNTDQWFPERGEDVRPAKALCAVCVVREQCLDFALDLGIKQGVWGGMSERERRKVRRARAVEERAA